MLEQSKLDDFITEQEVMTRFGIDKPLLTRLRYQGLPFCKLSKNNHIYEVSELIDWFRTKMTVLNQG